MLVTYFTFTVSDLAFPTSGTFQQLFNSSGSFPTRTSFPLQYPVSDIPTHVLLIFFGGRFRQVFPTPTNPSYRLLSHLLRR